MGTHFLCLSRAALPPAALASARVQTDETKEGSGVSPLMSSPLAGSCGVVLVISFPISSVSCFTENLCNSLAVPC